MPMMSTRKSIRTSHEAWRAQQMTALWTARLQRDVEPKEDAKDKDIEHKTERVAKLKECVNQLRCVMGDLPWREAVKEQVADATVDMLKQVADATVKKALETMMGFIERRQERTQNKMIGLVESRYVQIWERVQKDIAKRLGKT
eukprot:TRINITY_DN48202_c0_g1_i1.p1 TRINITY_DN48202_c0_g1~~TRINITY_DN48202_c0_g1_i1.p1  ORF type:complete len:144 (+),score=20.94 TRINITY_DN48202_c0_g1_i1:73-504(+)